MNDIENLKTEIMNGPKYPEDIVRLVYGCTYVMLVDPDQNQGIEWQPSLLASPTILALQLTFKKKALAKKIDAVKQLLFRKVCIIYGIMTCALLHVYIFTACYGVL